MKLLRTFREVREETGGRSTALVPTMGALHPGHASLVAIGRREADVVAMSIFVNPLQFEDRSDLERYPRDLDRDAATADAAGVDVLFAPDVAEVYPAEPMTRVTVDGVADAMEGAARPGHFTGVATVVAKLLAGVQPDVAIFGRKDAQQLAVVTRMAADLSFPVRIVGAPTLRDPDGLAMSSRNVFLGPDDRRRALQLSAGLFAAAERFTDGERSSATLAGIVTDALVSHEIDAEYVTVADASGAAPIATVDRPAFLAVAARVGPVRLIDNVFLWPDGSTDTGVRIDEERT